MARYLRSVGILSFVLLVLCALTVPLFAHHGAASVYDPKHKITLVGIVTKVLWLNPHITIFFDAPDPEHNGQMVNWELGDGQGPLALYRRGWGKDDLKPGDKITLTGATVAWNGGNRVGGGVITNAAGKEVYRGSKDDGLQ